MNRLFILSLSAILFLSFKTSEKDEKYLKAFKGEYFEIIIDESGLYQEKDQCNPLSLKLSTAPNDPAYQNVLGRVKFQGIQTEKHEILSARIDETGGVIFRTKPFIKDSYLIKLEAYDFNGMKMIQVRNVLDKQETKYFVEQEVYESLDIADKDC